MTVRIRRAAIDDAELLARLGTESFPGNFADGRYPPDMDAYISAAFSAQKQAAELREEGSAFFIAEVGGRAVGYARVRVSLAPDVVPPSQLEIERLYVIPGTTGRGVGSALIRACITEATKRRVSSVWLGVWSENSRAIRFYRRHGFEEAGTKEFVLGRERHRDLVLVRALPQAPRS